MPKSGISNPSTHLGIAGWIALALPASVLVAFVVAYARSFPIWETWYFIPVWKDFHQHGPWLSDLFIDRWGHITAIPNFVNLMLDSISGYDQRVDIFVSAAVAIASLYLLLRYYVPREAPLSRIFLGLTFLSVRASEIWLDGWNTVMTISLLFSIAAGACVLASRSWTGLAACAVLAFLGLNSGAYCLAILPAVLVLLAVQTWLGTHPMRRGITLMLAWLVWSILLFAYWKVMHPGSYGDAGAIAHTLLATHFLPLFARMQTLMLGDGRLGLAVSAGVLCVFGVGIVFAGWRRLAATPALPGLLYLVIYSATLTTLIETGRTASGLSPLHLRYIPFLCLLPVALLALAECLVTPSPNDPTRRDSRSIQLAGRYAISLGLCIFIASALWNDIHHYLHASRPNQPQLAALDRAWRQSPWTLTPGMFLYRAATDPDLVARGLQTMRRLRIGPFGQVSPTSRIPSRTEAKPDIHIHFGIDRAAVDTNGNLVVTGWSFDSVRDDPVADIYAQVGPCTETALTGFSRDDVAATFKTEHAKHSGWLITFPAKCVLSAHSIVTVYFVQPDSRWNTGEKQS